MKKIIALSVLLTAIFASTQAQLFKKLKEKAADNQSAGGTKAASSKNKLEGVYHSVTLFGKRYSYKLRPDTDVKIVDETNPSTTLLMVYYLTAKGEQNSNRYTFRKEITKEEVYFGWNADEVFLVKIDDNTIASVDFEKVKNATENTVNSVSIYSKDEAVIKDISKNGDPYRYNDNAFVMSCIKKALEIKNGKEAGDDVKGFAEWEQANKYAELPDVSAFQPAGLKAKADPVVKAAVEKWQKGSELLYWYFGVQPSITNPANWTITKEARRNDLGLDKIVTKRSMTVIAVCKMPGGMHCYNIFYLKEDVAPGVFDGSKFTGQYYIDGIQGPAGIATANSMKNKGK